MISTTVLDRALDDSPPGGNPEEPGVAPLDDGTGAVRSFLAFLTMGIPSCYDLGKDGVLCNILQFRRFLWEYQ